MKVLSETVLGGQHHPDSKGIWANYRVVFLMKRDIENSP